MHIASSSIAYWGQPFRLPPSQLSLATNSLLNYKNKKTQTESQAKKVMK